MLLASGQAKRTLSFFPVVKITSIQKADSALFKGGICLFVFAAE